MRKAAGLYWLLDLQQSGEQYIPPLAMNEMGAEIFKMQQAGEDAETIVRSLCERYDADENMIRKDVMSFLGKLREASEESRKGV